MVLCHKMVEKCFEFDPNSFSVLEKQLVFKVIFSKMAFWCHFSLKMLKNKVFCLWFVLRSELCWLQKGNQSVSWLGSKLHRPEWTQMRRAVTVCPPHFGLSITELSISVWLCLHTHSQHYSSSAVSFYSTLSSVNI